MGMNSDGYVVWGADDVNIRSPIILNDGENYIPGI